MDRPDSADPAFFFCVFHLVCGGGGSGDTAFFDFRQLHAQNHGGGAAFAGVGLGEGVCAGYGHYQRKEI